MTRFGKPAKMAIFPKAIVWQNGQKMVEPEIALPFVVNWFCRREQQRNDTTPGPTRVVFDSRAMHGARAVFDAHAIRGAHVECANFFLKYANLWAETKNMK